VVWVHLGETTGCPGLHWILQSLSLFAVRNVRVRQELTAAMLAANSGGRAPGALAWLDLGLERLASLGGPLGRGPPGCALAACTALVDLSAAANRLTCMRGARLYYRSTCACRLPLHRARLGASWQPHGSVSSCW
jgi:hypothetical protein